jgi:integrase
VLKKHGAIKSNPAMEIERLKAVKKIRRTTSADERKKINDYLVKHAYAFWRFIQIFFHSGSRESELMRLRARDVNLQKQTFICLVKKGRDYREHEGIIKDSVLHLWKEILENCKPDQYLFSKGLLPGDHPIRPDQVGRRWALHVKKKLKIQADLYSLKHTNTSAIAGILSDEDAARLNKHTTTAMVVNIYDVERKDRQAERIKRVNNEF